MHDRGGEDRDQRRRRARARRAEALPTPGPRARPTARCRGPAAVASVVSESAETTSRWRAPLSRPAEQHDADRRRSARSRARARRSRCAGAGRSWRSAVRPPRSGACGVVQRRPARRRATGGARRLRESASPVGDLVLDRRVASAQDQPGVQRQGDDAGDERRQHHARRGAPISRESAFSGEPVVHRALEEADRVEGRQRDADRRPRKRRRSSPGRRRSGCRTRR